MTSFCVCDLVSRYTYETQSMLFFYFKNRDYFVSVFKIQKFSLLLFSPFFYDHIIDDFLLLFSHPFPHWF